MIMNRKVLAGPGTATKTPGASGKKEKPHIIYLVACLLAISACSVTESDNIKSKGIEAKFAVKARGNGQTTVTGELKTGSGPLATDLDLHNGDQLTVTAQGISKTMQAEKNLFKGITYVAEFNFDTGGPEFVIALNRPDDISAPNSRVTLPEALEFTLPADNTRVGFDTDLDISWQPEGLSDSVDIVFTTLCPSANGGNNTHTEKRTVPDTGAFSLSTDIIVGTAASQAFFNQNCTSKIQLSRENRGDLDPNYGGGGKITALQSRSRTVIINLR